MKKYLLYFFGIFLLLLILPNNSFASPIIQSVTPKVFSMGDIVTIEGFGFNDRNSIYSQICWGDDGGCLASSNIKTWNDKKIVFEFTTTGMEPIGQLTIHAYYPENGNPEIRTGYGDKIKITPFISSIEANGKYTSEVYSGDTVIIHGYYFGYSEGIINGDFLSDIIYWGDNEIKFTISSPLKENLTTLSLSNSNNFDSNNIAITIKTFSVCGENSHSSVEGGCECDSGYTWLSKEEQNLDCIKIDLSEYQGYLDNANIPYLWSNLTPKSEIVVAVIDDGVYYNHPDLNDKIWQNTKEILGNGIDDDSNGYVDDKYGWNFIDKNNAVEVKGSHGTTVAGIIAAKKDKIGITGIAEKSKIMPLISCNLLGCPEDGIIDAIYYAVDNGAKVINISLGNENITSYSTGYDDAIKYAWDNDVIMVIAAGNGDNFDAGLDTSVYPLSIVCNETTNKMIIGVGASTKDNMHMTSWSNFGKCVDIYAQGEDIISSYVGDYTYNIQDGTSFSAPIVSGVVAAILSAYPQMNNEQIWDYLINNSDTQILNAEKAVKDIKKTYKPIIKQENSEPKIIESIFSDVLNTNINYKAISYMKEKGIINGYQDGTFKPVNSVNRAELLKILIESLKLDDFNRDEFDQNCFADIKKGEWYTPYVCYAKEKSWVKGYTDNTFKANQTVSKVEALKIILNAYGFVMPERLNEQPFDDILISEWFAPFIKVAKDKNFLEEKSGNFEPHNGMTRASVSQVIYNVLIYIENK